VRSSRRAQFIDGTDVLHLVGRPTGKINLSVGLGVEAIKAGHSVYFTTWFELSGTRHWLKR
jgi:DNA replication protein DnaC